MPKPPTANEAKAAMKSALAGKLEGIDELPKHVLLGCRDKRGSWGKVNAYHAYCFRCGEWLDFDKARGHRDCWGQYWDDELAKTEWQLWWQVSEICERVRKGMHPYWGDVYDRRSHDAVEGSAFPAFVSGQRQILRAPAAKGLSSGLEVMVDLPDSATASADFGDDGGPLKVLLYFHGQGGEDCMCAPASSAGYVVVAMNCPTFANDGVRCFWFTEGPGGAWDKHRHAELRRCDVMLAAVSEALELVLSGLARLDLAHGLKREIMLLGTSMGGCAVLQFARAFPSKVCAAAVIAGLYDEAQLPMLVEATAQIPFLLQHSRGDAACPFRTMERFYVARKEGLSNNGKRAHVHSHTDSSTGKRICVDSLGSTEGGERVAGCIDSIACAETEAWFSDGHQHGPSDEQMLSVIRWLRQRS